MLSIFSFASLPPVSRLRWRLLWSVVHLYLALPGMALTSQGTGAQQEWGLRARVGTGQSGVGARETPSNRAACVLPGNTEVPAPWLESWDPLVCSLQASAKAESSEAGGHRAQVKPPLSKPGKGSHLLFPFIPTAAVSPVPPSSASR